ncbi:tyrosine-type recombinase/integrase [Streptomyces bambusae]|uniref:Tyrosine-type recombinase/integrase n=1 Tax=Streptomyces bambusae TaxID=1550616 RepID=A0ABS6ZC03_9ACTN|nr:tyrosine-type recombinase/integrase [Streptomyces bambusae]MBW5485273.1 tyrosine-type recombinase/integrase [Streptomyces bambusae]
MYTYDVRIWGIRKRKSKKAPYQLRWIVGGEEQQAPFMTKTLADGRRSQLMKAVRDGEQFDTETGLPVSELRQLSSPTWYDHAQAYAYMKWPGAAAKHRVGIAEALATVTAALVTSANGAPHVKTLRLALRGWAFQMAKNSEGEWAPRLTVEEPPAEVAAALAWVAENSIRVSETADSENLRRALAALSRLLNGRQAADNTVLRKRSVLSNCLRYAVERGLLTTNPLTSIDWAPPKTDDEVDFQFVPGPELASRLLDAVRAQSHRGDHLHAFFGCMYYAGMRPGEVAALAKSHCKLPEAGWGELLLRRSQPEVGSRWTDDGRSYDSRGLKRRARRSSRSVPIPPVLVAMLRQHISAHGTAPDGRLFRAVEGGRVASNEYTRVWAEARRKALAPADVGTPLAAVPYSLRHACVSLWIKAGVDPVEVARRAGHSPAVLWKFYAKVLQGQQHASNQLIDQALADPGPAAAG